MDTIVDKKWTVEKSPNPVQVRYRDYAMVAGLDEIIQLQKKEKKDGLCNIMSPAPAADLEILRGKDRGVDLKTEDYKVVGLMVRPPFQASGEFKDFCEYNGIKLESPVKKETQERYFIEDFDAIRKLAVAGFEFPGADQLRLEQEQLRAAQQTRGWNPPPLK